jgi:hypothetical protein
MMSSARRARPDRLFVARRYAVRNTLTDQWHFSLQTAEAWCDAWEREADAQGIDRQDPDYWKPAAGWVLEQRKTRRTP